MSDNLMRTIFKGANILIIAYYAIVMISTFIKSGINFSTIFVGLIVFVVVYMAYSGLTGNYDTCKKIATVLLILSAIGTVLGGFKLSYIFFTIIMGIYLFMCISLNSRY